jgi:hypothetical protein
MLVLLAFLVSVLPGLPEMKPVGLHIDPGKAVQSLAPPSCRVFISRILMALKPDRATHRPSSAEGQLDHRGRFNWYSANTSIFLVCSQVRPT